MRKIQLVAVIFSLTIGSLVGLTGCSQPGEALIDRKKRENDTEIIQYIAQNNLTADTTLYGIYRIKTKVIANAQIPVEGDEVQYRYVAKRFDGLIVDSTYTTDNQPNAIVLGVAGQVVTITPAGLYEGIGLYTGVSVLREGESAILLVPSYYNSGRQGTLLLPQYSPIRYDVRIVNVRNEEEQITDYIKAKKLAITQKLDDGLRIVRTQAYPDSAQIKVGQTVKVKYTGTLLNDTQFDTGTIDVKVGEGRVVKGWEEGLQQLRRGEKVKFIFPSALGYGAAGDQRGTIKAYRPLAFDIEVVSVTN